LAATTINLRLAAIRLVAYEAADSGLLSPELASWVKAAIDSWTEASGIHEGGIFRSINKAGKVWGDGMTPKVLWEIVKQAAKAAGSDRLDQG
jgi:hypothetical protein